MTFEEREARYFPPICNVKAAPGLKRTSQGEVSL
jgi:hypothetical protein